MSLLRHLYLAMWSNMWAPSLPTLLGIAVHHVRQRRHREQLHEQLIDHTTAELDARLGGGR